MRSRDNAKFWMCSHAFATIAILRPPGDLLARNSERHLKSPREMAELFADLPEAIANTQVLSSRLQFAMSDLGYEFPRYPVPDGETQMSFLRDRTQEGMLARYGHDDERARKQIERELATDRKTQSCRVFPDRVGHRALLPREQYSRARTRFGGE